MSRSLRIDIKEPSKSLLDLLEAAASGVEGVDYILSEEDEYRLSGREVAKFVAISFAAGLIGNSAYDGSKAALHKVIAIIGEEAEKTSKPIYVVVDGVQLEISDSKEAEALELELNIELKTQQSDHGQ
jgi:hypothetical protein